MIEDLHYYICRYAWAFFLPLLLLCKPVEIFNIYQTNISLMVVVAAIFAGLTLISWSVYVKLRPFPRLETSIEGIDFSRKRFAKAIVLSAAGVWGAFGVLWGCLLLGTIASVPAILGPLGPFTEPQYHEPLRIASIGIAVISLAFGLSAIFAIGVLMQEHTRREILWSVLIGLILLPFLGPVKVHFGL